MEVAQDHRRPNRVSSRVPASCFADQAMVAGRYRIVRFIARGGMGEVYEALDTELDERVALKVVTAGSAQASRLAVERLRNEVQLARKVTHPNVCRIFDLGQHGLGTGEDERRVVFFTMEFLEGPTLSERIAQGPMAPEEALPIIEQITAALFAAHEAGIVHRDLKPSNVMLVGSRVVVTDFGIAQLSSSTPGEAGQTGKTTEIVGTPAYMAPEQLLGEEMTAATDIYALGAVIYEMVTGRRPYSARQTLKRLQHGPVSPRRWVSTLDRRWEAVILRCLRQKPKDRFARADQVTLGLTGQIDVFARGRRNTYAALGALAALVLLAGAGLWWWQGRLPPQNRRIAFSAQNLGPQEDDWLKLPMVRIAARELGEREPRLYATADEKDANVLVHLRYLQKDKRVRIQALFGPAAGRKRELLTTLTPSVTEGLEQILERLRDRLAKDQPLRQPTPEEKVQMDKLGVASLPAFLAYQRALRAAFSNEICDAETLRTLGEQVLQLQPGWPHALAFQLYMARGTASYRPLLERTRAAMKGYQGEDIGGQHLIEGTVLVEEGQGKKTIDEVAPVFLANPTDIMAGWLLISAYHRDERNVDSIAMLRKLYALRPELQFGSNLNKQLRMAGRSDEATHFLDQWIETAPESEPALVARTQIQIAEGQVDRAIRDATRQVILYGRGAFTLAEALVAAGRMDEAGQIADELVTSPGGRMYGLQLQATIAIFQGRFVAAQESLRASLEDTSNVGLHGGAMFSFSILYALLKVMGNRADQEQVLAQWSSFLHQVGDKRVRAVVEFRRLLLQTPEGTCPDVAATLDALAQGPGKAITRAQGLRAAAASGCLPCSEAIRQGLTAHENDQVALFDFAVCAEKEAAYPLAQEAFERVRRMRQSPAHEILALYHLGIIYQKRGETAQAKEMLKVFLGRWAGAQPRIPEIDRAREMLNHL